MATGVRLQDCVRLHAPGGAPIELDVALGKVWQRMCMCVYKYVCAYSCAHCHHTSSYAVKVGGGEWRDGGDWVAACVYACVHTDTTH